MVRVILFGGIYASLPFVSCSFLTDNASPWTLSLGSVLKLSRHTHGLRPLRGVLIGYDVVVLWLGMYGVICVGDGAGNELVGEEMSGDIEGSAKFLCDNK